MVYVAFVQNVQSVVAKSLRLELIKVDVAIKMSRPSK